MVLGSLFTGSEWRHRCKEWTCGHSGGGKSGRHGDNSVNICTLSGIRWIAGGKLLCITGSPVWHSVLTWRDRMGGGDVCLTISFRGDTRSRPSPEDPKPQGGGILESQQLLRCQGLQDGVCVGGVQLHICPLTPVCLCSGASIPT